MPRCEQCRLTSTFIQGGPLRASEWRSNPGGRVRGILFACIMTVLGTAGCNPSYYDPSRPLMTATQERFSLDATDAMFDGVFAKGAPVVLYVHGRGAEPGKSMRQNTLADMERENQVAVIMFG